MKWSRKLSFAVVMLALLGLVVSGCGGDDDDTETAAAGGGDGEVEQVEVMLPYQDSIAWTGYEIARDELYPDLGIEVETINADGDPYVSQQLIAGSVDFAVGGAVETVVANAQGHEMVSVANLNSDIFTMMTTADSGVSSLEDLEGEALGVTGLGGGEIPLVEAALRDAGLEPNEDVQLEVVGPGGPAAASSLQDGSIAAYAGATNDMAGMQAAGVELTPILPEKFSDLPSNELLVSPDVLEDPERLDTVLRVAAGWFDGLLLARDEPERGLEITCNYTPEECQDPAVAKAFYDVTLEGSVPEAESAGEHDLEKYEVVADSIVSDTEIGGAEDLDLEAIFTNEYTDEIAELMTKE